MVVLQRFLKPLPLVKPAIVRLRIRRLGVRISSGRIRNPWYQGVSLFPPHSDSAYAGNLRDVALLGPGTQLNELSHR